MRKFNYSRPQDLKGIISVLQTGQKARVLAGGTDLLGVINEKILPEGITEVVSLKAAGLNYIKEDGGCLRIGAMTTLNDLENAVVIKEKFPVLWQAAHQVAAPQIRNMATVGGNICQEPRCWYYRYQDNKFNCMRKGGSFCNAMTGNNPYHSVFGSAKVCDTACQRTCPNGTEISDYMEELRKGNIKEAAEILFRVNPIAAATGRVCPHTCQGECSRHLFDEAVSIRDAEKYLGDYILEHADQFFKKPVKETDKKAAVIGAGPAGLTAAYYLRRSGVKVVVIDQNKEAGGMLYYGIPSYRLPKDILKKIKAVLESMGVVFRMNTRIGKDLALSELQSEYDAVMAGIGAWTSQGLGCPGDDIEGVVGGIHFLNKVACHEEIDLGKNVIIVGGGNTAMDACRTAKRLGAENVCVVYRRTRAEMPADAEEIEEAMKEGIVFKYLANPIEVCKGRDGRISKVVLQKMKLGEPDQSGRRTPVPVEGATETVEADTLIAAIGQGIDLGGFESLKAGRKNEIITDKETFMTSMDKVFAAGDAVNGPKTAVEAIAGARRTANAMAAYLGAGCGSQCEEGCQSGCGLLSFDLGCLEHTAPQSAEVLPVGNRTVYGEDVSAQKIENILTESKRCFNCGCVAVSPSDVAPALIALDAVIVTTERRIPASEFFAAGIESSTVLKKDEIVTEIVISEKNAGSTQGYRKFRTRKSIDFPIAGLASNISVKDGKIASAKLVFSGVAPVPYEFNKVEAFLEGKEPTAEVAEMAGKMALEGAKPLKENMFKLQLIKMFVQRAVAEAK